MQKTWFFALNEERAEVMTLGAGKTWYPKVGRLVPASQLGLKSEHVQGFRVAKILDGKASAFAALMEGKRFLIEMFDHESATAYCNALEELSAAIECHRMKGVSFFAE
ncbi:MAG: hypothetical protein AAB652_00695 [Patescibacteria group bacterium]